MGRNTGQITRDLKARRKKLLKDYDAEELHQLRVDIRRLRSVLKLAGTDEASRLRKEWARIAKRSNLARDWDTFAAYVDKALEPNPKKVINPLLARKLRRAHRRVKKILLSSHWDAALKAWQAYEHRKVKNSATERALASRVELARRRVDDARWLALSQDDEASWHGLRIAIKDLRYTLENLQVESPTDQRQLRTGIGLCKMLQTELGDWHDTVIHSALAEQLVPTAATEKNAHTREAIQDLTDLIHQRGTACLEAARATLAANGYLFAPPAEGGIALGHEIERKFLVNPEVLDTLENGERIVQGFVETRGQMVVRARLAGEHAFLTLKGPSRGSVRSEFEYPIPPEDARRILDELCGRPLITKIRYRREYQGYTWEIDVFEEDNVGLVVAEVELGNASDSPELPPWVTKEVTDDLRYQNVNLARHPFSAWGEG